MAAIGAQRPAIHATNCFSSSSCSCLRMTSSSGGRPRSRCNVSRHRNTSTSIKSSAATRRSSPPIFNSTAASCPTLNTVGQHRAVALQEPAAGLQRRPQLVLLLFRAGTPAAAQLGILPGADRHRIARSRGRGRVSRSRDPGRRVAHGSLSCARRDQPRRRGEDRLRRPPVLAQDTGGASFVLSLSTGFFPSLDSSRQLDRHQRRTGAAAREASLRSIAA